MIDRKHIIGIVIAGGQATRMGGGDKTLMPLGDDPILAKVIENLKRQTPNVAINTNSPATSFAAFEAPVFADTLEGFQGPLAGILAAMLWTRHNHPAATHIATVAGDSPFFPADLVVKLSNEAPDQNTIMMAKSDGFNHPVFAIWPLALCDDLDRWLTDTGILKVMAWVRSHPHQFVDFTIHNGHDPFFNINTPDDLTAAHQLLTETEN